MTVQDGLATAQRDRLLDLLELVEDGIVVVTASLEIESANAAARALFGDAVLTAGCPLPEVWHGVSLRDLVEASLRAPEAAREARVEAGGRRFVVRSGTTGDGRFVLLVFRDVSARGRLTERDFVTNAAHQLRSPVAAISGVVEVLQSGAKDVPEERDRFLAHLERECARLSRATRALLTLARAQDGSQPAHLEVIELCPLLQTIARGLTTRPEVAVEVECPADLILLADPDLVAEALANIAGNAAAHTRVGRISLIGRRAGDDTVVVEITDTGSGMPPDVRDRATERFFRREGEHEEGFGLGLAIAAEALAATGAAFELESTPGSGTTARMTFRAGRLVTT